MKQLVLIIWWVSRVQLRLIHVRGVMVRVAVLLLLLLLLEVVVVGTGEGKAVAGLQVVVPHALRGQMRVLVLVTRLLQQQ
jgi:hypothetical protein